MKQCARCLETKPTTDFHKNSTTADGLAAYCKPCRKAYSSDPARVAVTNQRRRERYATTDPVERRIRRAMVEYGVGREVAEHHERATRCDWCTLTFEGSRGPAAKVLHHDHETGEYVATLCSRCNSIEGWVQAAALDLNITPAAYLAALTKGIT